MNPEVILPTRSIDPALKSLLATVKPGQRIRLTQTVRVGSTDVQFAMSERAMELNRVVVTGTAGVTQKREVGTSVAQVNVAEVTVSFSAQFISATTDGEGKLVDGDAKTVRDVTDVWTFERNVRASDPNWRLVATSGEAELQGH